MEGRTVVLKYCPYGKIFVEGDQERAVIGRVPVMRELGRLLDAAGRGAVEIRIVETAVQVDGGNNEWR
jgi:hypothetical protein